MEDLPTVRVQQVEQMWKVAATGVGECFSLQECAILGVSTFTLAPGQPRRDELPPFPMLTSVLTQN